MLGNAVLFFALINFSYCGKSFTIVLDSTFSMKEELGVIQANMRKLNFWNQTDFENYVLVPFKDANVEPPYIYNNPKDFVAQINTATTSAPTHICPENTLAGIEDALRFSKPESYIFIFTDAYARDYERLDEIKNLCRNTHSQIIIFLSGYCYSGPKNENGNVEVYHEIAKSCSGVLFQFNNTNELRQAFRFMEEITKTAWTDVTPHEKFEDFQQFTVTLDSFTTDFIIVATGSYPEIQVINNYQNQPTETILETKHALVTRIINTAPGTYTVKVRGHRWNSVTVYEKSQIKFEYGFSTRNPNSLRETSAKPIAGWTNYILIEIDYTTLQLTEIEWLTYKENIKKVLYLEQKRPGLYVTSVFVEPGKSFKFWIKGRNSDTYQDFKGSSKTLLPQATEANPAWTKPEAEILEPVTNMVDFGDNFTLICKVVGYPKPNITWEYEDKNILLPSEEIILEIPNVFLSYMTLSNLNKNTTVYCKCVNHEGADSNSIDIYVNRTFTFDVLQSPNDTEVQYGEELKLYCEVDAYPEATITWYLNGTEIETAYIDDTALVVDSIELDDNGVYECVASNGIERKTFKAVVTVTGIEVPEIDIEDTEVSLKPGDRKELFCSVNKGKPKPEITWKYKSLEAFQFEDLPYGVETEESVVKIGSAEKKHGGTYRCIATNIIGQDSKDIILKIQHPPIIKNTEEENVTVRENEEVKLECEVDSSPEAVVRWEMSQDDVIINFDEHNKIDTRNTLSFVARWNDSGSYSCIAENNVGRAHRSVFLNVLVPPYIEAAKSEVVNAHKGLNVNLTCNVLYGNPAPTTKWEFRAPNTAPRVVLRGNSNSTLHLTNVSKQHEGTYMCVVENTIDNDRIIYQLKVNV